MDTGSTPSEMGKTWYSICHAPCTLLLPPMTLSDILCHLTSIGLSFPIETKRKTYGLKTMISHLLGELPSNIRRSGTISRHLPLLTPSWTMHLTLKPVHDYSLLLLKNLEHG